MADSVPIEQLQPGDVLLYRGTSLLSKAIQYFDGSPLSHSALYLGGGQIGEALAQGLQVQDYQTSFGGSEWVKAYRLANQPADMTPVLTRARYYLDQGNRYGYEQLLLLGVLCMTRRLKMTSVLRRLLRTLLDAAAYELVHMLEAGKQPMICSEFVYRAYDEAEAPVIDAYSISIPGMLPLPEEASGMVGQPRAPIREAGQGVDPESLAALFASPASRTWVDEPPMPRAGAGAPPEAVDQPLLEQLIETHLEEAETGQTPGLRAEPVSLGELRASADRFVINLYRARPEGAQTRAVRRDIDAGAERTTAYQYLFRAAPDFVTPGDLYTTDSLRLVGTIETGTEPTRHRRNRERSHSMAKKALCVGINDYPYDGSDLSGCVNDAKGWAGLLVEHFGFAEADVQLLLDEQATKSAIVSGLEDLLSGAKRGDILVFTNSSHGTYVADTSGDEPRYDEAMCPYDCAENLIVDDELRELFSDLPSGVHLTVISDSCFSGTVTRVALGEVIPGLRTPDDRRVRFLSPALRGDPVLQNPWRASPKGRVKYPESRMREVLLSGCTDKEYSYDALLDGIYHGAMTFFALQAIRAANYQITYRQLASRVNYLLDEAGYPQHPQLEGRWSNKKRQVFS